MNPEPANRITLIEASIARLPRHHRLGSQMTRTTRPRKRPDRSFTQNEQAGDSVYGS